MMVDMLGNDLTPGQWAVTQRNRTAYGMGIGKVDKVFEKSVTIRRLCIDYRNRESAFGTQLVSIRNPNCIMGLPGFENETALVAGYAMSVFKEIFEAVVNGHKLGTDEVEVLRAHLHGVEPAGFRDLGIRRPNKKDGR